MDKKQTLINRIMARTSEGHVQWREDSHIPLVLNGDDGPLVYELRKAPMFAGRGPLARIPAITLMVREKASGDSVEVDDTQTDVAALLLSLLSAASDAAGGANEDDEAIGRLLSKIEN